MPINYRYCIVVSRSMVDSTLLELAHLDASGQLRAALPWHPTHVSKRLKISSGVHGVTNDLEVVGPDDLDLSSYVWRLGLPNLAPLSLQMYVGDELAYIELFAPYSDLSFALAELPSFTDLIVNIADRIGALACFLDREKDSSRDLRESLSHRRYLSLPQIYDEHAELLDVDLWAQHNGLIACTRQPVRAPIEPGDFAVSSARDTDMTPGTLCYIDIVTDDAAMIVPVGQRDGRSAEFVPLSSVRSMMPLRDLP